MHPNDLLVGLDREQREAVICGPTATIVQAGAGSGKTRVLTNRIAYRIATTDIKVLLDGNLSSNVYMALVYRQS